MFEIDPWDWNSRKWDLICLHPNYYDIIRESSNTMSLDYQSSSKVDWFGPLKRS